MAKCPPDTKAAILALADEVRAAGGTMQLSDLFRIRSHDATAGTVDAGLNGWQHCR